MVSPVPLVVPLFWHMIAINSFSSALSPIEISQGASATNYSNYAAEALRRLPHRYSLIMPTLQLSAMSFLKLLMFRTLTFPQGWLYLLELLAMFSIIVNAARPGLPLVLLTLQENFSKFLPWIFFKVGGVIFVPFFATQCNEKTLVKNSLGVGQYLSDKLDVILTISSPSPKSALYSWVIICH